MNRLVILCIEDEDEVRDAVVRDLEVFEPAFMVEMAEDADDARQVGEEVVAAGDKIALVIADHRLPGMQGTDFLIELHGPEAASEVQNILASAGYALYAARDEYPRLGEINEWKTYAVALPVDPGLT